MKTSLTENQISQILKLYEKGFRAKVIASLVGCTIPQVNHQIYVKHNLRSKYRKWTMRDIIRMKEMYLDGMSFKEIGEAYQIGPAWIKTMMESAGYSEESIKKENQSI